jgi:Flp pilus assembly protein CpaB
VELEYSDKNSRRSKVYIAVGVIAALLVAATVFVALRASGLTSDTTVDMRSVVVATRDIPARKAIEEGDVAVRNVAADPTNETAFTSLEQVLGRVVGVQVATGQLLTMNVLASTTEGQAFSILDTGAAYDPNGPDWRAVSLTVVDANAVGGTLVPGQMVDLIVTMPLNPEVGQTEEGAEEQAATVIPGPSTKVTLQSVTLLARTGSVYIVRADLDTAEKIAELVAVGGTFTMALRPLEDDRTADTDGSTVDQLIEEFGFPVPRPFEVPGPSRSADSETGG